MDDLISQITTALATDENVIKLARAEVIAMLPSLSEDQLNALLAILNG